MQILRQMGDIRIPTSSFILFVELCSHFWEPKYDHSFWATTFGGPVSADAKEHLTCDN